MTNTCYAGGVHDYPVVFEVHLNKELALERKAHLEAATQETYRIVVKDLKE